MEGDEPIICYFVTYTLGSDHKEFNYVLVPFYCGQCSHNLFDGIPFQDFHLIVMKLLSSNSNDDHDSGGNGERSASGFVTFTGDCDELFFITHNVFGQMPILSDDFYYKGVFDPSETRGDFISFVNIYDNVGIVLTSNSLAELTIDFVQVLKTEELQMIILKLGPLFVKICYDLITVQQGLDSIIFKKLVFDLGGDTEFGSIGECWLIDDTKLEVDSDQSSSDQLQSRLWTNVKIDSEEQVYELGGFASLSTFEQSIFQMASDSLTESVLMVEVF